VCETTQVENENIENIEKIAEKSIKGNTDQENRFDYSRNQKYGKKRQFRAHSLELP
jgi:hypothetical protein|tara:strand:+ start:105 stop:272 length:168 start_codon:yes stop_codon:yes gene_type:complete